MLAFRLVHWRDWGETPSTDVGGHAGHNALSPAAKTGDPCETTSEPERLGARSGRALRAERWERSTTLRDTGRRSHRDAHRQQDGRDSQDSADVRQGRRQYVLVGSVGGAPHILSGYTTCVPTQRSSSRDDTVVQAMRVREVTDETERGRLWKLARGGVSAVRGLPGEDDAADPTIVAAPTR